MMSPRKAHIALLAGPGLGHLIPVVELAKRLASLHGLTITLFAITPEHHHVQDQILRSATSSYPGLINTVVIPYQKQSSNNAITIPHMLAMIRSAFPALRSSISDMTNKPEAMIVDYFCTEALGAVAQQFNMVKYVFIFTNAWFLSYNLYLPYVNNNNNNNKEVNRDEPFHIPGCEPLLGQDIREFTFFPKEPTYKEFVRIGNEIAASDGILLNTWDQLEADTIAAFKDQRFMKPYTKAPVYPIGPLVRTGEPTGTQPELFEWLDHQPKESVVYVSFGGGGTISAQQTIELAWGLELSMQRFIWVVRPPNEYDNAGFHLKAIVSNKGMDDPISKYLPDGFLDRTHGVGLMVPMWAPQEEILARGSIGAFVSHCGWNSCLESIVNGVPIIAWPLYAEQNMNATMFVKKLGIAVQPEVSPSMDLVGRDEIATLVRRVMVDKEGIGIKTRVNELKASAKIALEGGTSFRALSEVVKNM